MPRAPARSKGETAPTVHTRSKRPCESRLICTASSTTCNKITPASSTTDLCREGMPAMVVRSSLCLKLSVVSRQPSVKNSAQSSAGRRVSGSPLSSPNAESRLPNTVFLIDANLPQQPEVAEHLPGAEHHRSQRIIRNRNRQARLFANPFVEIFQQRHANRIQDRGHALPQRFADFAVVDGHRARHAFYQIAAFHFHG